MRVLAYCRVSTTGQLGEDKFGFESQLSDIKKYCKEHNHQIIDVIQEQISGAKDERPLFNEVLYSDEVRDYDGVIVAKIDRLSRKVEDYFGFKYLLRKKGVELISANENEDFAKLGIFASVYETLISTFAELERQRINERMTGGRMVKAKQGGYAGGKVPYGYKAENGQLVIDEEEKKVVLKMFDLRKSGHSLQQIANALADEKILTRRQNVWVKSSIKSVLDNETFYKGEYTYADIKTKGKYTPIL